MIDESLRSVLDALQESVFILDTERRILFANRLARETFGEQFFDGDFIKVIRHPECVRTIQAVIEGRKSEQVTIETEQPVKAIFRILVTAFSDREADSRKKIIVSLADISNIHEAEQMRTDFVANVSHELRSPLTAITGFVETLKGPARDDAKARNRFLELLEHESHRMVRLIADLLSLSKVEANQRVRPSGTANLSDIIHRIENTLESVAKKEKKTIIAEFEGDANVPGSTDELTQVFQNLMENAIKYGKPESKIHIRGFHTENVAGMPGPSFQVDITDQGEGIPREHIARLTERFYRVDNHRSRDKGGTGLGLAIVKHIVNRHRGRLKITSEIGKGSTFTVILPLR